jgi:hypothetical protein
MRYWKKMMTAVALTIIVSVSIAASTEYLRDYLLFTWQVKEGEQFIFAVAVEGYTETGSRRFPIVQTVLNNTHLMVEIKSLPIDSIIIDGETFAEDVIQYMKTDLCFENSSAVPMNLFYEMNNLGSRCFLPTGSWDLLDSFYPDLFIQPINGTAESYVSYFLGSSFYLGHIVYGVNSNEGWNCICSMDTGIPSIMVSWAWSYGGLVEYSYNITLSFVS